MTCFGGHWKDYPGPKKRLFDDKRKKRRVSVSMQRYTGIGGRHFYVSLTEQDNPFWDGEDWRVCWDEPTTPEGGKGRFVSSKFQNHHDAIKWIEKQKKTFPTSTHVFVDGCSDQRWFYREGD